MIKTRSGTAIVDTKILTSDASGASIPIDVLIERPLQASQEEWISVVGLSGLIHRKNDVVANDPDSAVSAAREFVKCELETVSDSSGKLLDD